MRLKTRSAEVNVPLMAVKDMVKANQTVVFDSEGSFTYSKDTGVRTPFQSCNGGWELTLDLEAPQTANDVALQVLTSRRAEKIDNDKQIDSLERIRQIVGPFGRQWALHT